MPVSLAADWTTEALVSLLVAAVTDRVVQVPARAWSTARCAWPTVSTYPTILHPHVHTRLRPFSRWTCISRLLQWFSSYTYLKLVHLHRTDQNNLISSVASYHHVFIKSPILCVSTVAQRFIPSMSSLHSTCTSHPSLPLLITKHMLQINLIFMLTVIVFGG